VRAAAALEAPAGRAHDARTRDTVHVIRFVFVDRAAQSVSLVGDFNNWSREMTPLVPTANGDAWTVTVTLPPGRHEYAFIVRDAKAGRERWAADPLAPTLQDEFGTVSSVVQVGQPAGARAPASS